MRQRTAATSISVLVLLLSCSLAWGQAAPLKGLDTYANGAIHDWNVPGLAITVVKDGKVVLSKGYGVRKVGEPAPVDEHTLFAIGSISKSFTAMALGMLVDEGKLSWDDPVSRYLPYLQLYDPYVTRELTIRDLLTHRSGLPDVSGGILWYGSDYNREEVLKRIVHIKPVSSFRSTFAYQNVMYMAAGEVVHAVSGKSWDDFIRERIFTPLGMDESNSLYRDLQKSKNLAMPHVRLEGKSVAIEYRDSDNIGPAGSIVSSVNDMARYMQLLLAEGTSQGKKLYSDKVARELFTPQMLVPNPPSPRPELKSLDARFRAYGFGWFLRDYRGRKIISHTGGMDGMAAVVILVPEENLGITVLSHQDGGIFNAMAYRILDAYLGAPPTDWARIALKFRTEGEQKEKEAEAAQVAARTQGTKPSLELGRYAGKYRDRMYGDLSIANENGRLVLRFSHSPAFTADLEHWQYDTFRTHWRDPMGFPQGFMTFSFDSGGKIRGFTFDQPKLLDVNFDELAVERVPEPN
ncbi:serine hydrolase [Vitiosangium sp. GDMCC 1.1324]|uniref:serine hydrolase n=1 Tax=Vitiosangium sp. (strain GDMCC 1.1324) TaxID=2138576 RepID=UPI00130D721C|nr:serine hydrolase [Vitiosangium sp. GDMCC 1.1324]